MYFIALVAPAEINTEVLRWKSLMKERFDCEVALRSPAHITLIQPFWMDSNLEHELKEAIADFSGKRTYPSIVLQNFSSFKPKVIYVDVATNPSLTMLQQQLEEFLLSKELFPFKRDDRPFHPHVTIATRDLRKKAYAEAWTIFEKKTYEARWQVDGISLLKHNQKNWDVIFTSQSEN